ILFVCYVGASLVATREFLDLLPEAVRPAEALTLGFVCVLAGFNWWPAYLETRDVPPGLGTSDLIGACVLLGTGAAFVYEMWRFRGPDRITERVALTAFTLVYLGVLPSFLAQNRCLPRILTPAAPSLPLLRPTGN